jgi:hypothetical protein
VTLRIGSALSNWRLALITGALAGKQRGHPSLFGGFRRTNVAGRDSPPEEGCIRSMVRPDPQRGNHDSNGRTSVLYPELVIAKWAAFQNSNYNSYTFVPFPDYPSGSILGMSYSSYSRRSAPSLNRRVSHSGSAVNHSPGHPLVRLSYSGFPFATTHTPAVIRLRRYTLCRTARGRRTRVREEVDHIFAGEACSRVARIPACHVNWQLAKCLPNCILSWPRLRRRRPATSVSNQWFAKLASTGEVELNGT